jgi:hypothetical protein
MLHRASLALLAALVVCAVPAGLQAQTQPQGRARVRQQVLRPYQGLFGAGSPVEPGGHALDMTLSVYEEYGNNIDDETPTPQLVLGKEWFTGVRGGLSFERVGQHTQFALRSEGSVRYYQDSGELTTPRGRVELALSGTGGRRRVSTWHLDGSAAYEPYYVLPLFGAQTVDATSSAMVPSSRDDLLFPSRRMVFGHSFGYEKDISARWTFGIFDDLRLTQAEVDNYDVWSVRGGARLGRRLTRYASLRMGYAYQTGRFGLNTDRRLENHDIELSLDYRRPLPRMRRTTFGFSTGSSRVHAEDEQRWEVIGTVNLRHDFEDGWFLEGEFARNVRLVEGFASPFLQNTTSARMGGFIGRRVDLLMSGGYSRGTVGAAAGAYTAIQAGARLRFALARYLAVDAEGLWNKHDFAATVTVPDAVLSRLDRRSIRCNLTLWLPLSR